MKSGRDIVHEMMGIDALMGGERATDYIFDKFDEALKCNRIDLCNEILAGIDERACSPSLLRSVLVVTYVHRHKLSEWIPFYDRAALKIKGVRGEVVASKLLAELTP